MGNLLMILIGILTLAAMFAAAVGIQFVLCIFQALRRQPQKSGPQPVGISAARPAIHRVAKPHKAA